MRAQPAVHAGHHEPAHDRPPDQRPVPQAKPRPGQRGDAPQERFGGVHPGEAAEFQIARQQGARHHLDAARHEREAERHDDSLNRRLTEEPRNDTREADRQDEEGRARDHGQATELRDLIFGEVASLHDGEAQPQLVHELHEAGVHHGHREQPVIGGRDEARHDQRGGPAHELREPLDAPRPRDPLREGAVEVGRGLAHPGLGTARAGPCSSRPRHAASSRPGVAAPQRTQATGWLDSANGTIGGTAQNLF